MCFVSFQIFIAADENIPKRSILINMIHTAVLVWKFLINLRFKKLIDIHNNNNNNNNNNSNKLYYANVQGIDMVTLLQCYNVSIMPA